MNDMNSQFSPLFNSALSKMCSDMRFVGMFYIIMGALYCLTIVGAIIGVPFIFCGIRLRESSDSFTNYMGTSQLGFIESALERQAKFFNIQKILMIIALVLIVIYVILIIAFIGYFATMFGGDFDPEMMNTFIRILI
jgi:hypothetical protein